MSGGATANSSGKILIKKHYSLPTWLVVDGKYMDGIYREFNDSRGGNFLGCLTISEFIQWAEAVSEGECKPAAKFDTDQKKLFAVEI